MLQIVEVLSWVGGLMLKALQESIEDTGHDTTKARSDPVDPVVSRELMVDHI